MTKRISYDMNFGASTLVKTGDPAVVSGVRFTTFKDLGWHYHNMAIVGVVEAGIIGMRTEHGSFAISSRMLTYFPVNCPHYEEGMGSEVTGWYLCLPEDRTRLLPKHPCILEMSDLLLQLCKRIVSWGPLKREEKTPEQKRLVLTFLDEIATAKPQHHLSIPYPQSSALCLVAKLILEKPEDMQTIDHWAQVAAMSRRSFTEHFRRETGLSFGDWRTRVKLHEALKMLSEGKKSVTEIGGDLGYQNTSSFIEVFREQFGLSPKKYIERETDNQSAVSKAQEGAGSGRDEKY